MRKTTTNFKSLQATALLLVACIAVGLVADCLGRPLPNERRRAARGNSTSKTNVTAALLHRQLRGRRQTFTNNDVKNPDSYNASNFPDSNNVESTVEPPTPETSCYQWKNVTYRETKYGYNDDGVMEKKEVNVTREERRCCDGWTGEDCNKPLPAPTPRPYNPDNPCEGLNCTGNPNAVCLTIKKCGRDLPVFYDERGVVAKCDNGQPIDMREVTCLQICKRNPCENLTCDSRPDAVCFPSSCDCQPMWMVDGGKEVDCNSGHVLAPKLERRRRQISDENSTGSTGGGRSEVDCNSA